MLLFDITINFTQRYHAILSILVYERCLELGGSPGKPNNVEIRFFFSNYDIYVSLEVVLRLCCHARKSTPVAVDFQTELAPSMQRLTVRTLHSKPYIIVRLLT